jgi:hypothetical protein
MVPPRIKIAGVLWMISPWTMNVSFAHDSFAHDSFADTIYYWVSRQTQPLQYRPALMCQYSRIDDPQHYTKEELSSKEIER